MTNPPHIIDVRLSLVSCTPQATRVLTTLDASNRIRKLPELACEIRPDETVEQAIRRALGPNLCQHLTHIEQIETRSENQKLTIHVLGLVSDYSQFRLAATDWWPLFELFPWEDWRKAAPTAVSQILLPSLYRWAQQQSGRRKRHKTAIALLFADNNQPWACENLAARYVY
ncbi:hypothetical protein MNBD_ALPHA06-1474, partial [hydrothermal vent metagenome]